LQKNYEQILGKYVDMSLEEFGVKKFFDLLPYADSKQVANEGFAMLSPVSIEPHKVSGSQIVTP